MKLNKLTKSIVVASSATAIAFFVYKAYIVYKDLKARQITEDELQAEFEAKQIVREHNKKMAYISEAVKTPEEIRQIVMDEELRADKYYIPTEEEVDEALKQMDLYPMEIDDDEEDPDIYVDPEDMGEEGAEELRYEPNTKEALNQYKEMMLAEFDAMGNAKKLMWKLFDIPFHSSNSQDRNIVDYIIDERTRFFGEDCKWNDKVSIADLILHFAKMSSFDIGQGLEFWTNQFIYHIGLRPDMSEVEMNNTIGNLIRHSLATDKGYGMFALDNDQYQKMVHGMTVRQDPTPSFTKQYHVFLEYWLEAEVG